MKLFSTLRTHKKKSIAAAIFLVLLVLFIARASRPKEPEYVTEAAKTGDIRQTVEAVGTVISEKELELRFAGVGVVQSVFVKEGQTVVPGQRLAQLRSGSLGASVAAQQASLQQALANLQALEQGTRPEDIAIAEADVQAKQAALQVAQTTLKTAEQNLLTSEGQLRTLQHEENVALSGQVSTSMTAQSQQLVAMENALSVIDDVLGDASVQDAIIKDKPGGDNATRLQKQSALTAIFSARAVIATDVEGTIQALDSARKASVIASTAIDSLFSLISTVRETSTFTNADRETVKASISTQRAAIQSASNTLATLQSNLQTSAAQYSTKIDAQKSTIASLQGTRDKSKSDMLTYQAAIQTSQAQLALKKAGTRQADINAARAQVRAAQANLARAAADYADTLLVAPIAGTISHVNVKPGEGLPAEAPVTMIGDSPFRVEMFVSEIDVPKLLLTQTGSIELDAFRGKHMKLHVSEIETSPTVKEGVSKYGVKMDFQYSHTELKVGMTGDAEVTTGTRINVLSIPRRAVLDRDDGSHYVRILGADKKVEERPVTIGMEGASGDVEVMNGVKEGEVVIVLVKK